MAINVESGFNPWEHLQSTLMSVQNKIVREDFSDIGDIDNDDITTPRSSLRMACTLRDEDTATMTLLRMMLFYLVMHKASDFHPQMFAIPASVMMNEQQTPNQIKLYFQETASDTEPGYAPILGSISLRWRGHTATDTSRNEVVALAQKIRTIFGTGTRYKWRKGKTLVTYADKAKGHFFQIYCINDTEGKRVVNSVLDILSETPDSKFYTIKVADNPTAAYPTIPGTRTILGKTVRKSRKLPVATVVFQYATLLMQEYGSPICLVDYSTRRTIPVISHDTGAVNESWVKRLGRETA